MTLFPEWQEAHAAEAALPQRIKQMRAIYGKDDAHTCRDCVHLIRYHRGGRRMKCELSRQSQSNATDWKAGFPACGKFEKETNE